jgi:hypothetical protein
VNFLYAISYTFGALASPQPPDQSDDQDQEEATNENQVAKTRSKVNCYLFSEQEKHTLRLVTPMCRLLLAGRYLTAAI